MRNWDERVPVACQTCGRIYIATPTGEDSFCVTPGDCRRCGGTTFVPLDQL